MAKANKAKSANPDMLANLYFIWTLNCVYETTLSIAQDFNLRPRRYSECDGVGGQLFELAISASRSINWPARDTRAATLSPIFGNSHQSPNLFDRSSFHVLGERLRNAAIHYSISGASAPQKEELMTAASQFANYLETFNIPPIKACYGLIWNSFTHCCSVLVHQDLLTLFGVKSDIPNRWPFEFSQTACRLIGVVSAEIPTFRIGRLSEDKFASIHQLSLTGKTIIEKLMDSSFLIHLKDDDDLTSEFSGLCIQWKRAIEQAMRTTVS